MMDIARNTLNKVLTPEDTRVSRMALGASRVTSGLKPAACRCLFGRPSQADRDATHLEVREAMVLAQERFKLKYNFDIKQEKPLDGKYTWQKVDRQDISGCQKENKSEVLPIISDAVPECAITVEPVKHTPAESIKSPGSSMSRSLKRRRSTLTDFYPTCKKARSRKALRRHLNL